MKPPVELHSPKQVAQALGVSESSLKRWCDGGLIKTTRTAGGHRKVTTAEIIRFARERGMTLVSPELLGFPSTVSNKSHSFHTGSRLLAESLLAGNDALSRQLVMNLVLSGHPMERIFDEVIAKAFVEIGEQWACEQADVYQERRGCESILRILAEISNLHASETGTLTAYGGTASGNNYSLQTLMAEIVLRGCGYHAKSLGSAIPFSSLVRAVQDLRPTLFWFSAAFISDETEFLRGFNRLSSACRETQTVLVIGGRALTPVIREQMGEATYCENMQQLAAIARTVARVNQRSQTAASNTSKHEPPGGKSPSPVLSRTAPRKKK